MCPIEPPSALLGDLSISRSPHESFAPSAPPTIVAQAAADRDIASCVQAENTRLTGLEDVTITHTSGTESIEVPTIVIARARPGAERARPGPSTRPCSADLAPGTHPMTRDAGHSPTTDADAKTGTLDAHTQPPDAGKVTLLEEAAQQVRPSASFLCMAWRSSDPYPRPLRLVQLGTSIAGG